MAGVSSIVDGSDASLPSDVAVDRADRAVDSPAMLPDGRLAIAYLTVLLGLALFSLLGSPLYWYGDDPMVVHFADTTHATAGWFDVDSIRNFGAGGALVPMFVTSVKLDALLWGARPLPFYLHQLASALLAGLGILALFLRMGCRRSVAYLLATAWFLAAPTGSVFHYISTRHYMEGLVFGLVAVLAAWPLFASDRPPSRRSLCLALLCMNAAALFKEVHLVVYPLFFFAAVRRRRWAFAGFVAASAGGYLAYRAWGVGLRTTYGGQQPIGLEAVPGFLAKLASMSAAGSCGAVLCLMVLLLVAISWIRDRSSRLPLALMLAMLVLSILVVYPVAAPMMATWETPNSWYRGAFVPAFLMIALAAMACARLPHRVALPAAAIIGLLLAPGYFATRAAWRSEKRAHENEARAYLAHPDKLLLSRLPAYWYLFGIHRLELGDAPMHFQPLENTLGAPDNLYLPPVKLREFGTGYLATEGGGIVESPEAFARAMAESSSRYAQ